MKYLFLFLLLTACGVPNKPNKPSGLDAKYFKRDKLYPYMYLKNGYLECIPSGGLDYRTRKPLPPIGSPYWGNAEAFTNEYEQLNLRVPITFKNAGKVLAYTNGAGGIFLNEEEILVAPEELTALIKKYPAFFEHYPYEDMLFAYTNFAESFLAEVTNMEQVRENIYILDEREKQYQAHETEIIKQYNKAGVTGHTWQYTLETFSNYYVSPENSLRILQVLETYQQFLISMYSTIDRAGGDAYDVLSKSVQGILAREISPVLSFLPEDDLLGFHTAVLNLMWVRCYTSQESPAKLQFPWLFAPMAWEMEQRGLWKYWIQVPKGKRL